MTSDDTLNRILTRADVMVAGRIRESEARLSGDVWAASISRRVRRAVGLCAAFAILGLAAMGVAVAVGVHANNLHQQNSAALDAQTTTILRALAQQDRIRSDQFAAVLNAMHRLQLKNAARITYIERVIDPDYSRDQIAWRIMGSDGSAGSGGTSRSRYELPFQQPTRPPASWAPFAAWPVATP